MATQDPAVPSYIFRGHGCTVHALHFFSSNKFLASADGEGWIVVWSLATKRPMAVWKAHEGGVMALNDWGGDRLISHGRDHVLRVWQLRDSDFAGLSIKLPIDGADASNSKQPWLLHSMTANALNYCAFSQCDEPSNSPTHEISAKYRPQLIATPNGLDAGGIDIFQLPSQHRICQVSSSNKPDTGMVMALSLFEEHSQRRLTLVSGYESGHIIVRQKTLVEEDHGTWRILEVNQPHTQPVLSIATTSGTNFFLSSSADSIIARFKMPLDVAQGNISTSVPDKINQTKHAGQQDITIRDDDKIFATAGWDKRVRVYSIKTLKELAMLKWHQEGCYTVAFANTLPHNHQEETATTEMASAIVQTSAEMLHEKRHAKASSKHWLAAGGKDGKISLWDIY